MSEFRRLHGRESQTWAVEDPAAHGRAVRSMFARISGVYDLMNHLLSLNRDRQWRRHVVACLDADANEVLDLCAGTGDLALTGVQKGRGRAWIAADFCPEMLQGVHGKKGSDALMLSAADAMNLPLAKACVDAVTVGFGVRNFADIRQGVAEMARVLRPGGQVLVLEFFKDDRSADGPHKGVPAILRFGLNTVIPWVGRVVGRDQAAYSYLPNSMDAFLTTGEFVSALEDQGFIDTFVQRQTFGIAHIVGGRLPR